MDPYLEARELWGGFHSRLVEGIYRALATVLPQGYIVDTAVRRYTVITGMKSDSEMLPTPDVTIEEDDSLPMLPFLFERFEEPYVEICAKAEEPFLVTCIEVMSPSNTQRGTEGWAEFEQKRRSLLLGRANFIEIDLLRGGDRMPMMTPWPDSPYSLLVSRAERAPRCRAWPAHFRRRLPPIPVPLLAPDPDLTLDL